MIWKGISKAKVKPSSVFSPFDFMEKLKCFVCKYRCSFEEEKKRRNKINIFFLLSCRKLKIQPFVPLFFKTIFEGFVLEDFRDFTDASKRRNKIESFSAYEAKKKILRSPRRNCSALWPKLKVFFLNIYYGFLKKES